MIDMLIVQAAIGIPQPRHQTALAQVSFARFSTSKSKPTTTFLNSPTTGAQIDVKYWVDEVFDPTAYVQIRLPLASATIGQNYIHAGLDSIEHETSCAAVMVKIILTALRFTADEIQRFLDGATTELLELTWHSETASQRALRSLQTRTFGWFEQQREASAYHDIAVSDVDYRRKNGAPCVLVEFKGGDKFRQYGKFDQTAALSKNGKQRYALSPYLTKNKPELMAAISSHARNELIVEGATLKSLGLQSPRSWTAESLRTALDAVWGKTGLVDTSLRGSVACWKPLSPEVNRTLQRYRDGDRTLKETLASATFSRHRKAILDYDNTDIARKQGRNAVRPQSLRQLPYDRRWEPKGGLRAFTLSEVTGPNVLLELQRGLAFLEDGVVPEFEDKLQRDQWVVRWKNFAVRERLIGTET